MKQMILSALLGALCASAVMAQPEPKVAATVNGEKITIEELTAAWDALPEDVRVNYDRNGGKIAYLDTFIRRKLIVQEALKNNLPANPSIAAEIRRSREEILFDGYVSEILSKAIISDAEVRAYYDGHQEEFRREERIRARHIIATPSEQQVANTTADNAMTDEQALEKIKAIAQQFQIAAAGEQRLRPEQFADMAVKFSEDGSASVGGDLGWFARGRMVPEFENVAFATPIGQTSGVVKTQFGYHVIFIEDREDAGLVPFEEARGEIRERLMRTRGDQIVGAINQLSSDLRRASAINIYRENF